MSRSISDSPLDFEITRVDCTCILYERLYSSLLNRNYVNKVILIVKYLNLREIHYIRAKLSRMSF